MLESIARLALAAPRRVLGVAAIVVVCAGVLGVPVVSSLSAGGFEDPEAESSRAAELMTAHFERGDLQMLLTVTSGAGVNSSVARAVGTDIARRLQSSPNVSDVTSPWTVPPASAAALVSRDGKTGLIVAGIRGGGSDGQKHAKALAAQFVGDHGGVTVTAGGPAIAYVQINQQSEHDLLRVEAIAIPLSFVALVWVFGGLFAAALPLAVGIMAIVGATAVLRLITFTGEVSTFALNLTVAMGLALAVDYTLLILSRFRDELADGADRDEALRRTMTTAGRTVLFSALTVALSMMALVFFPMYFLQSFAYAGAAVVAFAAAAAVVVTPAAIVLLGDRLDALDVRRLGRRLLRRPPRPAPRHRQSFWYRSTKAVQRRAIPVGVAIIALLLMLGAPFLGIKWGFPDDRILPTSTSARQIGDTLRTDFALNPANDVTIVAPDTTGVTMQGLGRYAAQASLIPDVASVSSPAGTFAGGAHIGPPGPATGLRSGNAFLTVRSTAPLFSAASDRQLDRLHDLDGPNGETVLITGVAQINRDIAASISSRLPIVLTVIALISFTLLFALTGSIVIPIKALALNMLSLTATFGALVWIFQDGHLGGLGTTATATLVANIPVLLFCIAFGLSMDYEVFLISRIREYWVGSARTADDNDESVAMGLAHTARVVTAAALLMSISFAALIAAQVSIVRMFGVGLTLAVLMDATLVRMLLMPAFMHVLGTRNWWAPRWLARLHAALAEDDDPPTSTVPAESASPARR